MDRLELQKSHLVVIAMYRHPASCASNLTSSSYIHLDAQCDIHVAKRPVLLSSGIECRCATGLVEDQRMRKDQ